MAESLLLGLHEEVRQLDVATSGAEELVGGGQGGPAVLDFDADAVADEIQVLLEASQFSLGDLRPAESFVPLDREAELEAGAGFLGADVAVRSAALVAGDAEGQVKVRQSRVAGQT